MQGYWIWLALCLIPHARSDDAGADTLVLCPRPLRAALQPWVDYREGQGHRLLVVEPAASSFAIQQQVRHASRDNPLRHLVIIGDAQNDVSQGRDAIVPTDYQIAMVNVQFGGEPDIATDNSYADVNRDGRLDLTLGRIPVDTPAQLTQFVRRVIAYESQLDSGIWSRKINFVAGTGNFDPIIDKVIENASKQMITDLIPASYDTSMTLTSWQSAYCPNPQRLSKTVVERLNEGCLFWVYIGHGLPSSVAPMKVGRQSFPVLDNQIASQANALHGFPIAIFLACYSGAFDRKKDCLGEVLVCQPGGPIACLCGSRMTMPYGMATLSYQIMNEFFEHDHATLGEVILCAKQKLAANELEGEHRKMIEGLGQSFSPRSELLALERFEHLQMFHLLGDPLLRVRRPQPLDLQVELSTDEHRTARVSIAAPSNGELVIDVCYKRDRLRFRPERRKTFDVSRASLEAFDDTYRKSNALTCCSQTFRVEAGPFSAELPIPADANGECHVRAYLTSGKQSWAQAIPVVLR